MLTHLKAWSFVKRNAIHECVKTLWIDEINGLSTEKPLQLTKTANLKIKKMKSHEMILYIKSAINHILSTTSTTWASST